MNTSDGRENTVPGDDGGGAGVTHKRLYVVEAESIAKPIAEAPGFLKKGLADRKLDLMGRCAFSCSYCSSNSGNYMRIRTAQFKELAFQQFGLDLNPTRDPNAAIIWTDVEERLAEQLSTKRKTWGHGETLVVSMLTDAFSDLPRISGTTRRALDAVLSKTSFRIRILTKWAGIASPAWLPYFKEHRDRFVLGLSTGTLDDAWAQAVELGTSKPSARLRAHGRILDAGLAAFGMLCPIFPDVLESGKLDELVRRIRPREVETVWAEPYNNRSNWDDVQRGYRPGSTGFVWLEDTFGPNGSTALWSRYATDLYLRLRELAERDGWLDKLVYLLYELDITEEDARRFPSDLRGVSLQSPLSAKTNRTMHPVFAALQQANAGAP